MPDSDWFPLHTKPGMSRCAGAVAEPSEKTSDNVPVSVIGPPDGSGFDEL